MAIVDVNGRPLERATLNEPQTSKVASLGRTFAGHPSRGLTPAKLATILQEAEQGNLIRQAELFMDMEEKDAHIFAEMSKRKRAILNLDWDIVPPRNATAAEIADAEWVKEVLLDFADLDDLMLDALDAIGHGFSCIELEWQLLGREWIVKKANHRPQTWFCTDRNDQNIIRLRDNSYTGAELQAFGWICHVHKAKSGYVARSGLHRVLSWPYLFKNYSVRDLAEFLEIYGLPLRLGKYNSGASPDDKAALLSAVVNIGHAAAGIIPQGMEIDFEEAASGSADPHLAMIDWAERSESKAIVGQTTSAEAKATGLGSGIANLHGEVRHDLSVSDARQLGGSLTKSLVYNLLALNRGIRDPRRLPRFLFDTGEAEDLKTYADSLPKLVGVGMRIKPEWVHEKLRIPLAAEGETVLKVARPDLAVPPEERVPTPPADPAQAAARAKVVALKADLADDDEFDQLSNLMAEDWQRVVSPLVTPIEALVAQCISEGATLEEFRARLPEVIAKMDANALAEFIASGDYAAALWGRLDNGVK